ncbi:MAG: type III pantothenate kinase [Oscillospiraceae bacterium]|nr:type III pantothenate kinase [Oscillospiraceae bacterium]
MILTVDAGNTHTLLGCWQDDSIAHTGRTFTLAQRTVQEWALLLRDIMKLGDISPEQIMGAALSCVVPPITASLSQGIALAFGCEPVVVGPGIKTGLDITIDDPAQLGSDMVCNAVAALELYTLPIIIFDMGTATSVSVLDTKGRFSGGAIVPGIRTALDALSAKASQLPHVALDAVPKRVIGKNTIDCMQSGALFGAAAMIEGMTERIEQELGSACTVLITGGHSEIISRCLRIEASHIPTLLLEGLHKIYAKNCE